MLQLLCSISKDGIPFLEKKGSSGLLLLLPGGFGGGAGGSLKPIRLKGMHIHILKFIFKK